MYWLSALTFGRGSDLIKRGAPLTSPEIRHKARNLVPMKAYPYESKGEPSEREPRIVPTNDQAEEYEILRQLIGSYQYKSIPVELYRAVSRKVEDYRCNYDWRDQIIEKDGNKGLISAFGSMVLPPVFREIPERYSSIYGEVPLIPVMRGYKYALAVSQIDVYSKSPGADKEKELATPYEYDDAFLIPFSNGKFYAVRIGEKWAVLKYDKQFGLRTITDFVLDAIYPIVANNDAESRIFPIVSGGKFGFISDMHYMKPEYDDFEMDDFTGDVKLYKDGDVIEIIDTSLPL